MPPLPTASSLPVTYVPRPGLPAFCLELGETTRGTILLLDLLSTRWQALLQQGPPEATALLWQQILATLAATHQAGEIQVWMFSPRPEVFGPHLLPWPPSWFLTAHPQHFIAQIVTLFSALPDRERSPIHLVLIDDLAALDPQSNQVARLLQVIFLEGARHGLRLIASEHEAPTHHRLEPLQQCFTNRIVYVGERWYRLYRRQDTVDFRLTLDTFHLPRD